MSWNLCLSLIGVKSWNFEMFYGTVNRNISCWKHQTDFLKCCISVVWNCAMNVKQFHLIRWKIYSTLFCPALFYCRCSGKEKGGLEMKQDNKFWLWAIQKIPAWKISSGIFSWEAALLYTAVLHPPYQRQIKCDLFSRQLLPTNTFLILSPPAKRHCLILVAQVQALLFQATSYSFEQKGDFLPQMYTA